VAGEVGHNRARTCTLKATKRSRQEIPARAAQALADEDEDFVLYVRDEVLSGVRFYLREDSERERGGVLLGWNADKGDRHLVFIEDFIPLRSTDSSLVHFSFDDQALLELYLNLPGYRPFYPVGWFHSHPGFGDPFMSPTDRKLHSDHFREPWHVSLVVDVGLWSLPVGFWRMEGNELIEIQRYYVRMTEASSRTEQSARFLRACLPEKEPLHALLSRLGEILPAVMPSSGERLQRLLHRSFGPEREQPLRRTQISPVQKVLRLATAMAEDPETARDIAELDKILEQVRFQEDSVQVLLHSRALQSHIAVQGDRCYSFEPGGHGIFAVADLVCNEIRQSKLEPTQRIVDLCCPRSDVLWILTVTGTLVIIDWETALGEGHLPLKHLTLPGVLGEGREIAASGDFMWIRTADRAYQFRVVLAEDEVSLVCEEEIPLEDDAVLIRGTSEGGVVLLGNGFLWRKSFTRTSEVGMDLPEWLAGSEVRLQQAVLCSIGLLLLVDIGKARHLFLCDPVTMAVRTAYLRSRPAHDNVKVDSLAVDSRGRAYLMQGFSLYLIIDSGKPNPNWYYADS
jgi:proteasome lid subunit RPN8/RPN11